MSAARPKVDVDNHSQRAADLAFENANIWLMDAREAIDEICGGGTAKNHPAMVGAFVIACAVSYLAESQWLRLSLDVEAAQPERMADDGN